MNNNDAIGTIVFFLTYFTTKDFANQMGPFAGILIAAMAGAGWYVSKPGAALGIVKSCWVFVLRVLIATVLAGSLAELVQAVLTSFGSTVQLPRSVVMPIAFVVAGFTDEIKDVLTALWEKYGKRA